MRRSLDVLNQWIVRQVGLEQMLVGLLTHRSDASIIQASYKNAILIAEEVVVEQKMAVTMDSEVIKLVNLLPKRRCSELF